MLLFFFFGRNLLFARLSLSADFLFWGGGKKGDERKRILLSLQATEKLGTS